jgi:predicted nucleic acid-binding protein
VLNEFVNVLRRKLRRSWDDIDAALQDASALLLPPKSLTVQTHATAMTACRDVGCTFYDGLILASAQESGCDEVLTEDLQHVRRWGGLTIRNPFQT